MKRIACSGIGLVLFVSLAGIGAAQNQAPAASQNSSSGSSLGDYARQIRKDPGATSKPKVFDNDNMPKTDKLSVVGQTTATTTATSQTKPAESDGATPAANDAKATTDTKTTESKTDTADKAPLNANKTQAPDDPAAKQTAWKQMEEKINAQKEQISLLTREFDVLQREYQIRAAAMYADAGNRMRNSADWDKQDAQYKQEIADKQKALDEAKQKLDEMQEAARKAGAPNSIRE